MTIHDLCSASIVCFLALSSLVLLPVFLKVIFLSLCTDNSLYPELELAVCRFCASCSISATLQSVNSDPCQHIQCSWAGHGVGAGPQVPSGLQSGELCGAVLWYRGVGGAFVNGAQPFSSGTVLLPGTSWPLMEHSQPVWCFSLSDPLQCVSLPGFHKHNLCSQRRI